LLPRWTAEVPRDLKTISILGNPISDI